MSNEEDDSPTVVLDFNKIKGKLSFEEELTSENIQFNVDFKDIDPLEEEEKKEDSQKNIYLFDYQSDFFKTALPHHTGKDNLIIIESLSALNTALKEDPNSIICFYYNSKPKAVNQLTKQIKQKFTQAKSLIIAEHLSAEKAQRHANSQFAADAYLSWPFKLNDFYNSIAGLEG